MIYSNEQMDQAIDRWRKIPTLEQLYADLAEDVDFKAALDAAAERAMKSNDPKARFWEVDAAGWRPTQFNVDIPPANPDPPNLSIQKREGNLKLPDIKALGKSIF
jgi:hypothetical protein